jgi:hypothetical protein
MVFLVIMLPLELWECISFYLENATEVGSLFTALIVSIPLKPSNLPTHIRNDMIACTITHNRKDIFIRIITGNETFLNDLWNLLSCSFRFRSPEEVERIRKLIQSWSRRNGGCPWDVSTITNAAMHSTTDVVKWLYSQNCPWEKDAMCNYAAWSDNLELLLWLREQGCPCTASAYCWNRYPKTHKVRAWMENEEKMGPYLKMFNYNFNGLDAKLLDFAI